MIRPWIVALVALGLAAMVASSPAPQSLVSLAQMNDSEFINKKIRCVLDEAPCDAMGKKLKDMLPDILQTGCANCSPFVKGNVNRLIRYAQQKYPKEWKRIKAKYGKNNQGR